MLNYGKYALSLIVLFLMVSCSERIITSSQDNDYVAYSETINMQNANINNSGLRSIVSDFIIDLTIFENGVNSFSPYPIDYFVLAESLCRNDSSLIVLKALAGSYLFYGHANDLDERRLAQFRITEIDGCNVIIARDIEESFCIDKKVDIYKESVHEGEFKLNWYKKSNGDRLIDFYPYFFRIYYLNDSKIENLELVFPDRIQGLR